MTGQRSSSRWTPVAVLLGALIPLAPIVAGVVLTHDGAGMGPASAQLSPVVPTAAPPRLTRAFSSRPSGASVALLTRNTTIRSRPGGRALGTLPMRTPFGSPEAMWVVQRSAGWLGVINPVAGNGRVGWIPDTTAQLIRVPWELKVSLSARRLTVLDSGRLIARYTVAIGRPDAPTPTGRFDVTDRLTPGDPTGPYGCCILALSAQAPHAIQGWNGGNRIAIHSTPETSSIGLPVSHGCLRLTLAEGRWLMRHIPLGTPTVISS